MSADRRKHVRIQAKDIQAAIILTDEHGLEAEMLGELLDMSYSGVRIKLREPMPADLPDGNISIVLTMPESGIKAKIKGFLRHTIEPSHLGLEYVDEHHEHSVDEFLFECIRHADDMQTKP
jgi:c-di-GMP-binding flagellar brake protein YcgR